ncbi:MAG: hypothetical protein HYX68_16000 [Planctomycetes bacterium]|nr:hypothetical protein [Planctomycetota bacterium]
MLATIRSPQFHRNRGLTGRTKTIPLAFPWSFTAVVVMGVSLDLRVIDHERIVVRGLEVVNAAIRQRNLDLLRTYLADLPIEVNQEAVDYRVARLAKLREFAAPAIIIENEERLLRFANGEAYRPSEFASASFDDLRHLLGTWCWVAHSYSLDKAWQQLHWFLEPGHGPKDHPLFPLRPMRGDPGQTIFDKALLGMSSYPIDDLGSPVIRTLGSIEDDCFGYNPPEVVKVIHDALECVTLNSWTGHIPFRSELYRQDNPAIDDEEIASRVENDLSFAREAFPILRAAYRTAAEKGYGVSCEYSL